MSHPHSPIRTALSVSFDEANGKAFHPRRTVRCADHPVFQTQLARNFGCLLDVDEDVGAWSCLPVEFPLDDLCLPAEKIYVHFGQHAAGSLPESDMSIEGVYIGRDDEIVAGVYFRFVCNHPDWDDVAIEMPLQTAAAMSKTVGMFVSDGDDIETVLQRIDYIGDPEIGEDCELIRHAFSLAVNAML